MQNGKTDDKPIYSGIGKRCTQPATGQFIQKLKSGTHINPMCEKHHTAAVVDMKFDAKDWKAYKTAADA